MARVLSRPGEGPAAPANGAAAARASAATTVPAAPTVPPAGGMSIRAAVFLWSTAAAGAGALVALWAGQIAEPDGWLQPEIIAASLLVAVAGGVAGRWPLTLAPEQKLDLSSLPIFLGILLLPPPLAAAAGALASGSSSAALKRHPRNVLFNAGLYALACGAAAPAFQSVFQAGASGAWPGAASLLGALLAGAIYLLVTSAGVGAMAALRRGQLVGSTWLRLLRAGLAAEASFLAIAALVGLVLQQAPWLAGLSLVPVWLAYRAHRDAAALRAVSTRLQSVLEQQRRFVSDTAHELKTPLTSIRGHADLLLRESRLAPGEQRAVGEIAREATRLSRTVADLLTVARKEEGLTLRQEPVDLEALVYDAYRQFRRQAEGVRFQLLGLDDLDAGLVVAGDPDRLRQLLTNLLDNALKFTPPGGSIQLRVAREEALAVLAVADTGPGIPPEYLPRIFDRYYRVQPTGGNGHRLGGVGLGLAIARAIAEAHGGAIEVESAPGRGSTFTVRLPLTMSAVPTGSNNRHS
ncbi:MAG: HAMP domain-containing histidine kinase [Chloroflexi bacterium]|nr:HAMP domain-containing histidine kinase [Chloroflexota bacterium]